jgi:8-oxo-dGTP pyrophosphatase MutT (NUDIX family)
MGNSESVAEVSAGGFVISMTDPQSIALMARFNRGGKLEWCIPKGHPEEEESIEQAAIREVFEETGLVVEIEAHLGEVKYQFSQSGKKISKTVHVFLMRQVAGELSLEHDPHHEASELAWVKVDDLLAKLSHSNEKRVAEIVVELVKARG